MQTPPTSAALFPIRILAGLGLIGVWNIFHWVLRHRRGLTRVAYEDRVVPDLRGPRNNLVLMACAITAVVSSLLLFLVIAA